MGGVNAEEKERETARNTTEGQTPVGSPRSTDQHEIVRNETSNAPDASGSAQPSRAPVAEFDEAGPRGRGHKTGIQIRSSSAKEKVLQSLNSKK